MKKTVVILAKSADVQVARVLAKDWCASAGRDGDKSAVEMLPIALAPKGETAPTHYMCLMHIDDPTIAHMQAHREAHNSPVTITVVSEVRQAHEHKANVNKFLESVGLREVPG